MQYMLCQKDEAQLSVSMAGMMCCECCRMQKWASQAGSTSCMRPGAGFHTLQHRVEGAQQQGNDYLVSLAEYRPQHSMTGECCAWWAVAHNRTACTGD